MHTIGDGEDDGCGHVGMRNETAVDGIEKVSREGKFYRRRELQRAPLSGVGKRKKGECGGFENGEGGRCPIRRGVTSLDPAWGKTVRKETCKGTRKVSRSVGQKGS